MSIQTISWNLAGAKALKNPELSNKNNAVTRSSDVYLQEYIDAYNRTWNSLLGGGRLPDIILLQECIGFRADRSLASKYPPGKDILYRIFTGSNGNEPLSLNEYYCEFFPAISSDMNPHPGKWDKYRREVIMNGKRQPYIPNDVVIEQGYGVCIRKRRLRKIWIPLEKYRKEDAGIDIPESDGNNEQYKLCFEVVNMSVGSFLGNRDTEPRLAVFGRCCFRGRKNDTYVNFINVHLTTLKGEREGSIRRNRLASEMRLGQLGLILDGIVSAYQESETWRVPRPRPGDAQDDIWIIGGDFNTTRESEEFRLMKSSGFLEAVSDYAITDEEGNAEIDGKEGTKWSIDKNQGVVGPPIVVDYIFYGITGTTYPKNKTPPTTYAPRRPSFKGFESFQSDHAVLRAEIPID